MYFLISCSIFIKNVLLDQTFNTKIADFGLSHMKKSSCIIIFVYIFNLVNTLDDGINIGTSALNGNSSTRGVFGTPE